MRKLFPLIFLAIQAQATPRLLHSGLFLHPIDSTDWRTSKIWLQDAPAKAITTSGGIFHAVTQDGRLASWGKTYEDLANPPLQESSVAGVLSGPAGMMASISTGGTLSIHGCQINSSYQTDGAISIAMGQGFLLLVQPDSSITISKPCPTLHPVGAVPGPAIPAGLSSVKAVAAGDQHALALKSDGTIAAWGDNTHGQCTVPSGLDKVITISARGAQSMALRADGSVLGWGDNTHGQSNVPASSLKVTAIAAGSDHSLALREDGTVAAWGDNTHGQCSVPENLSDVISIAADIGTSMALKRDGSVVIWGQGNRTVTQPPEDVLSVSSSPTHSLAIREDGCIIGWGDNSRGQLDLPNQACRYKAVAAGFAHSLALRDDGKVDAWGDTSRIEGNLPYSFGSFDVGKIRVPATLNQVTAISAGNDHSLALREDGSVVAWGSNEFGQVSVPTGLTQVVAIAAGVRHSVALKSDGTLVAWGDTAHGQTSVPAGLGKIASIAIGEYASLALREDGSLLAWGDTSLLGIDAGTPPLAAIAAGTRHFVGLGRDGSVFTWGIAPNFPATANAQAIFAGGSQTWILQSSSPSNAIKTRTSAPQGFNPGPVRIRNLAGRLLWSGRLETLSQTSRMQLPKGILLIESLSQNRVFRVTGLGR